MWRPALVPLISSCCGLLRTLGAACSLATSFVSMTSVPNIAGLSCFWCSMSFRHAPHSSEKVGKNNSTGKNIKSIPKKLFWTLQKEIDNKVWSKIFLTQMVHEERIFRIFLKTIIYHPRNCTAWIIFNTVNL